MSQQVAVTIRILDKEFQIGCPPEEQDALLASAEYLNKQMQSVRGSGVVGTDRIAILAALNITRDMLQQQQSASDMRSLSEGIDDLSNRIKNSLLELTSNP